jgi:signal transduction histidine kinase
LYLSTLTSQQSIDPYGLGIENPLALASDPEDGPLAFSVVFAVLSLLAGAVALVTRVRRNRDPVVRAQLRWLAWAGGVVAVAYATLFVPPLLGLDESGLADVAATIVVLSFGLIPVAIGVAVLRYRLYDIDLVIRKTIVFAVVVAFIAIVYVGLVVGVGAAIGSRTSPVLSAVAAAIVALVFQPVRSRAARLADRVVYGQRATPYEVLANFSERVGETYAAEDVLERMARVVGEGVGARRAEVWMRLGDRDRLAAIWPSDGEPSARPEANDAVFPVEHQDAVLGSLALTAPANDPLTPAKRNLVTHLAAQAGLVLHNVRLTEELRARLDDLRAAQKRLVAAQDQERKRIERNIHDGAQQQLVALAVRLGLTDQLIDRDPAKAHESIAQLKAETQTALEDLRNLARGIYPPLLADEGLGAALDAQARRAALPVETDVRLERRLAPEVEAAVYFSCLESLQNVAKYAGATAARVLVEQTDGVVTFEVADDGAGFDPGARGYGTGLQGISDRLGALDGTLEVHSEPGRGTVVRGRVPVAHADA